MKNVKHIILHRFPTFPGLTVWKLCCFYFNLIRQAAYSLYGVNFKCIWFTTRDNDSWSHVNRFCHLVIFFHGLRQATFENKSISEYALFNIVQVTIYHSVLIQVMLIPRIFMRDIKCRYFIGKCVEKGWEFSENKPSFWLHKSIKPNCSIFSQISELH